MRGDRILGQADAKLVAQNVHRQVRSLLVAQLRHADADADQVDRHALVQVGRVLEHLGRVALNVVPARFDVGHVRRFRVQTERQVMRGHPRVRGQDREAVTEVPGCGASRHARLGPARRHQEHRRRLQPLSRILEQPDRLAQVRRDVDHLLSERVQTTSQQHPAQAHVDLGARRLSERVVRGLLDAIMQEAVSRADLQSATASARQLGLLGGVAVRPIQRQDQALGQRRLKLASGVRRAAIAHRGQRVEVEAGAKARGDLQQPGCRVGEAREPLRHQLGDVVRDPARHRGVQVPRPTRRGRIEANDAVEREPLHELVDEERVAAGAIVDERRQRPRLRALDVHAVRDQRLHRLYAQRAKLKRGRRAARARQALQRRAERVRRPHFLLAKGADQEQPARVAVGREHLHQRQRRQIGPLQVVEEDRERLAGRQERAEEATEDVSEAGDRLSRARLGQRRLRAQDQLEVRDHVRNHRAVRPQGLLQATAQRRQPGLRQRQRLADEVLQRADPREVRKVATVQIELAGREPTVSGGDPGLHLVHERRLSDAGATRHQHHLDLTRGHTLQGAEQGGLLCLAAVEVVGHQEVIPSIALAEREADVRLSLARGVQAASQIHGQTHRGLVALLGALAQKPGRDRGHRERNLRRQLAHLGRVHGDVRVHQLERILAKERRPPSQQVEERRA